ncbi:unnamed protein product [Urochloa humidicola]
MWSMEYDDNGKKPRSDHHHQQQKQRRSRTMVLLLILTNLSSILLFSGAGAALHAHIARHYPAVIHSWGSSSKLLRELNVTGLALAASHAEVSDLSSRLTAANKQLESILRGGSSSSAVKHAISAARDEQRSDTSNGLWHPNHHHLSAELRRAVGPHKLRHSSGAGAGEMEVFPAVGQACHRYISELEQYMNYTPGGECPSDEAFAQRLMLKGCEPLPRRRCRPRTPAGYVEPTPLPASLWSIPPDTSIIWDAYTCKSYTCLVNRGKTKGSYDCKDCFDLAGRERHRWMRRPGDKEEESDDGRKNSLDYTIDGVLTSMFPKGTARIGVDIGGESGTFAARMKERGVTVVTTSMNFDGPFCSFVASRGLVAMHVSVAGRLPFPDGTMDIVHSMHVLSSWIPDVALEMALFDVYRVLRPGGVFWLDHFFCLGSQMEVTYVPMFERIGFEKVKWNAGRKLDRGVAMDEWYISALLRKPRR